MTQLEYEQKKRECWEEYWRTHKTYLHGDSAEIVLHETFTDAFDRAYALGKQTETISQEEIEKAALDYIRTNPFVNFRTATTARESFVDGANFALGKQEIKQETDAEGEEMLTVSRKKIQKVYRQNKEEINRENVSSSDKDCYETVNEVLKTLFGSKCLPDNVDSSEPNIDSSHGNVDSLKSKPAEPKFKVGDKVKAHYPYGDEIGHIQEVMLDGTYDIDFGGGCTGHGITEDMLEPYTEQKEEKSEHLHAESVENLQIADEESHLRNLSQETANCDKEFDTILKDGFRNERRLNIAAMAMQGLLANSHQELVDMKIKQVAQLSLEMTDALIAEAEKGNSDGED